MLPQLRMMQNAKVVEKFTAHYVFALGLSRFVSCAHWVLQVRRQANHVEDSIRQMHRLLC